MLESKWFKEQDELANTLGYKISSMDFLCRPTTSVPDRSHFELRDDARRAFLRDDIDFSSFAHDGPKIKPSHNEIFYIHQESNRFDYWAISLKREFFRRQYLTENRENHTAGKVVPQNRIWRVSAMLRLMGRLYGRDPRIVQDKKMCLNVTVRHNFIKDIELLGEDHESYTPPKHCYVKHQTGQAIVPLTDTREGGVERLAGHVETLLAPLFLMFDFTEISRGKYQQHVKEILENDPFYQ